MIASHVRVLLLDQEEDAQPLIPTVTLPNACPVKLVSARSLLLGDRDIPVSVPMNSPVMETPSQRAASHKAEQDSGLSDLKAEAEIDIQYLESVTCGMCCTCGIYVGPDHYERSFYFAFVRNQYIWNSDNTRSRIGNEGYLVFLCGGCAQGLPDSQRLLDRIHCETNYLMVNSLDIRFPLAQHELDEPWEKQRIADLAREYMVEQFRWYLLLTMICYRINYRFAFYSHAQRQLEEARKRVAEMAKDEEKRHKRRVALLRKQRQMTQDRSLPEPSVHRAHPLSLPVNTPQQHPVARANDLFDRRCSFSV